MNPKNPAPCEIIAIHTPGKVGSSTLHEALKARNRWPCYHTHFLDPEKLEAVANKLKIHTKTLNGHVADSAEVLRKMSNPRCKLKVITVVRDPLARNVSSFFENLELYGFNPDQLPNVRDMVAIFLSKVPLFTMDKWLDREIGGVFGLNRQCVPFCRNAGIALFQKNGIEFLFLKAEVSDWQKEAILQSWLGDIDIKLKRANITANKSVAPIYEEFKSELASQFSAVEAIYQSNWFRHFYTKEETGKFINGWKSKGTSGLP
ncbi:MAG: sulfotransferase family 2 domain-containing protein [Opitutales bacterium]|nr:sulfotransferase family 2 domain-containing protein [Opitutales bacterium]MCH8539395.1 putative capsular polysaccharide synthesis family protein [Opitutales bacterium]